MTSHLPRHLHQHGAARAAPSRGGRRPRVRGDDERRAWSPPGPPCPSPTPRPTRATGSPASRPPSAPRAAASSSPSPSSSPSAWSASSNCGDTDWRVRSTELNLRRRPLGPRRGLRLGGGARHRPMALPRPEVRAHRAAHRRRQHRRPAGGAEDRLHQRGRPARRLDSAYEKRRRPVRRLDRRPHRPHRVEPACPRTSKASASSSPTAVSRAYSDWN